MTNEIFKLELGAAVKKAGGSYQCTGYIAARFLTHNGEVRYVMCLYEPMGLLHIYNEKQLEELTVYEKCDVLEKLIPELLKEEFGLVTKIHADILSIGIYGIPIGMQDDVKLFLDDKLEGLGLSYTLRMLK